MSRPKLRPLSDLLPSKGAASRPEVVSHPTIQDVRTSHLDTEQASSQPNILAKLEESKHAPLLQSEQAREHASINASLQARDHASMQGPDIAADDAIEFRVGPRSAVSFRMTEGLQNRLREYAHKTRRTKQDILDEALHEHLRQHGY